jgi:hypothetical protein
MTKIRKKSSKVDLASVIALCAILAGCAEPLQSPPSLFRNSDRSLSCEAIVVEVANNNRAIELEGNRKYLPVYRNITVKAGATVLAIYWFGPNFGTDDPKLFYLQNRQQYLSVLATQRHCVI